MQSAGSYPLQILTVCNQPADIWIFSSIIQSTCDTPPPCTVTTSSSLSHKKPVSLLLEVIINYKGDQYKILCCVPHVSVQLIFVISIISDPKKDVTIAIEGKKVVVPQGKPINQSKFSKSNFSQSEYLIYKESQNRIRYLLQCIF